MYDEKNCIQFGSKNVFIWLLHVQMADSFLTCVFRFQIAGCSWYRSSIYENEVSIVRSLLAFSARQSLLVSVIMFYQLQLQVKRGISWLCHGGLVSMMKTKDSRDFLVPSVASTLDVTM